MQLFPYQIEGARFLAERGRALLADEMGLGKSAQAIAACVKLALPHDRILVVCPASVVENWKREFKRFGPMFAPTVVSYNGVDKLDPTKPWSALILDEAHYLKNAKAKRTQAIFGKKCDGRGGLVERAKHVFCLTGTPTPNHPGELWPMLRAVMPGAVTREKPLTYWSFVNRYCKTRDNGFGIQIVGGKNLDDLKRSISPYVLRRKKEEVLKDLPPIRFDELPLELKVPNGFYVDGEQERLIERALDADGVDGLKAIATHVAQLRRLTGMAKVVAVTDWVKEQFEGGLEKLVVFAHHRDVLSALQQSLHGSDWSNVVVTGATPSADRDALVWDFQNEPSCRVFLGQIQAAGTGITLTAASDLLFVESSWVPAENEQAAMRIHRIGQRNACLVRFATLAGSIDERIQRAVMRKAQDIAKLFS